MTESMTKQADMTIEEAKLKKAQAEDQINEILNNFFDETRLVIDDIQLKDTWQDRRARLPDRYSVRIFARA